MIKIAIVLIPIIILVACKNAGAPGNPHTQCPYELDGIQGNIATSYATVDSAGNYVNFECASIETGMWAADVWHNSDGQNDDLSDFWIYENGQEKELSRIFMVDGHWTMFDAGGYPYTQDECGEFWDPTDTEIVRWGRTEWQLICYGRSLQ